MKNTQTNSLAMLTAFSINDDLEQIKQDSAESFFLFDRFILKGQASILFAPPNAGKTLLMINQLKQAHATGLLNGLSTFYINADDTQDGIIEKTEILRNLDVQVLTPGYKKFESNSLLGILDGFSAVDAKNVVIIIDTLKKFADTMDKKNMRNFGITVREFIMKGGTLIGLGHTNKNRDTNNNLVYSGTSDIKEDVDCIYMMDIEEQKTDSSGLQTTYIKLINQKLRGNNALEITYVYEKPKDMSYIGIVNSVYNIDSDTYSKEKILRDEESKYTRFINRYQDAVSLITNLLSSAETDKTELRDHLVNHTDYGRDKCIEIIDKLSGKLIDFKMGGKTGRKKFYYLITSA